MSAPLDNARLAEIQARCDAASAGPWILDLPDLAMREAYAELCKLYLGREDVRLEVVGNAQAATEIEVETLTFIAAARVDVPDLIAEVQRFRKGIAALHRPNPEPGREMHCVTCCVSGDAHTHDDGPMGRGKPICATVALIA